jgi:hypothetical protein
MKRWLNLAAILLLPIAALTLFTPFYQTNDDVGMRLLAEGHLVPGSKPVPFLMFINVVIGKLLATLYSIAPAMPWYDLLLGASLIAAAAALVSVWIESGRVWTIVLAVFLLLPAFVSMQFTIVALTCAAAGIALIVDGRHERLGIALFVWGSMIRFEGAPLMAIEGAVLCLVMIRPRPRLGPVIIASIVTIVLFAVNHMAYDRSGGWNEFAEFNWIRSRLTEHIAPEQVTPRMLVRLQNEVGWSANDFALFCDWYFADANVYSLERMRKAAAIVAAEPSLRIRLGNAIDDAGAFLLKLRWFFLLVGIFVLARGAPARLVIDFLAMTLVIVLLIGTTSVLGKTPPPRIYWPMLILGATMLAIASRRYEPPPRRWLHAIGILAAIFAGTPSLMALHRMSEQRRADAAIAMNAAAQIRAIGARLVIIHGNAFPFEDYWRPLHTSPALFPFIALGSSQRTPLLQDALRRGASTDVAWSLCSDPTLLLVAWDVLPPRLEQSVREHHGVSVRFVPLFRSERVSAWRCLVPPPRGGTSVHATVSTSPRAH